MLSSLPHFITSLLYYFITPLQVDRSILFPNEKIGFVIAVLLLILAGIALLLIRMDRRLSRLEKAAQDETRRS